MPDAKKQRAGRKGGQVVSRDRAHMAAIGRKGGQRSRVKRSQKQEQHEQPERNQAVVGAQAGGQVEALDVQGDGKPERDTVHGASDNAIEIIKADHERVNSLFEDYETAGGEDKIAIAEKIMKELEIHTAIEEEIFYPAFKDKAGEQGQEQIAEALEEHQSVKMALKELKTMDPEDETFESAFQDMMHDVQHHVREEEGEMLPLAQEVLGDSLEELGTDIQRRKHDLMEHRATEALH